MRHGQHPLSDRHAGQDVVDEMRGPFGHAEPATTRTEAAGRSVVRPGSICPRLMPEEAEREASTEEQPFQRFDTVLRGAQYTVVRG